MKDGEYSRWLEGQGLSATTIKIRTKFYRSRLRAWGTWEVPPDVIAAWLSGYTGWSRLTYHSHLSSVYAWLVESGQLVLNPMASIRKPPTPRPRPRPLTDLDLRRAFEAADPRTEAFLALGFYAGLRAFEIAKFHGRDIDEHGVTVLGKGGRRAVLPTHPALWEIAETFPRGGYWFPSPAAHREHILADTVTTRVGALFSSLGLAGATHRARHSYGTSLLRGGANLRVVQELMRHSSLATTAAYLGVDEDERRAAIRGLAA